MPDTRPGIKFDSYGVCYPCLYADERKTVDWADRMTDLQMLLAHHSTRHANDPYDCVVAVSGGKDSHVQVAILRDLGMRPMLVSVGDWFGKTKVGQKNFEAMCNANNCDSLLFRQSPALMRKMVKTAFLEVGSPTWPIDAAIYSVPLRAAQMLGVELVVYGEDIAATYGGPGVVGGPSARRQIDNDVVKPLDANWWLARGITLPEMLTYPPAEVVENLEPFYLGYYIPWSGADNYMAAQATGFRSCDGEWGRGGCIENYDQIDSIGYMVHPWLKYPKYGHARATDVASNWIREGRITRDEGVDLVLANDHILDDWAADDFCRFTGITTDYFYAHIDTIYNLELFTKTGGNWSLKNPVSKL
jgi:N-acetyl sugar amidotransferase